MKPRRGMCCVWTKKAEERVSRRCEGAILVRVRESPSEKVTVEQRGGREPGR